MNKLPAEVITDLYSRLSIKDKKSLKKTNKYIGNYYNNSSSWKDVISLKLTSHISVGRDERFVSNSDPEIVDLTVQDLSEIIPFCHNIKAILFSNEYFECRHVLQLLKDNADTLNNVKCLKFIQYDLYQEMPKNAMGELLDIFSNSLESLKIDLKDKIVLNSLEKCSNIINLHLDIPSELKIDFKKLKNLKIFVYNFSNRKSKPLDISLFDNLHYFETNNVKCIPITQMNVPAFNLVQRRALKTDIDHVVKIINICKPRIVIYHHNLSIGMFIDILNILEDVELYIDSNYFSNTTRGMIDFFDTCNPKYPFVLENINGIKANLENNNIDFVYKPISKVIKIGKITIGWNNGDFKKIKEFVY